jgi:predicted regulator of Ras-like GTPase activity (Roadblock/LC7/MglB family)
LSTIMGRKQLDAIESILRAKLIDYNVHCVFLIDMAGNIIADIDNGKTSHDIYSLAALAAGNFAAVNAMANIIGETEFSLLFHRGKNENMHFSKVMDDFLLITIFGGEVSLGFLRLKVSEAAEEIKSVLKLTTE